MNTVFPELILDARFPRSSTTGPISLGFCSEVISPVPGGDCLVQVTRDHSAIPAPWQNERIAEYLAAHFVPLGFHWFNPAMITRAMKRELFPGDYVIWTEHRDRRIVQAENQLDRFAVLLRKAGLVHTACTTDRTFEPEPAYASLNHTLFYDTPNHLGKLLAAPFTIQFPVQEYLRRKFLDLIQAADWIAAEPGLWVNPAHCHMISDNKVFLSRFESIPLANFSGAGRDRLYALPWMEPSPGTQINLLSVNLHYREVRVEPDRCTLRLGECDHLLRVPDWQVAQIAEAARLAQGKHSS